MPVNLREYLLDTVRRSIDGEAWHGPSLSDALSGVSAGEAAARPIANAHSIWEITLHVAGWADEVARRLGGASPGEPDGGDWPAVGETSEVAWLSALQLLATARDAVLRTLEGLPEQKFSERLGSADAPLGTGHTYAGMLEGLAQHNTYHAGQIVMLRKALENRG